MYSQITKDYVKKQIQRHKEGHDDALWRIASHCDLFNNLNPNGELTNSQKQKVLQFIKRFSN